MLDHQIVLGTGTKVVFQKAILRNLRDKWARIRTIIRVLSVCGSVLTGLGAKMGH